MKKHIKQKVVIPDSDKNDKNADELLGSVLIMSKNY